MTIDDLLVKMIDDDGQLNNDYVLWLTVQRSNKTN